VCRAAAAHSVALAALAIETDGLYLGSNRCTLIGVRMAAQGSLMSLAKQPASTVQILGAEKALFRALKTKAETPKYDLPDPRCIIFFSSFPHPAPHPAPHPTPPDPTPRPHR
jgi:hypothetical protein